MRQKLYTLQVWDLQQGKCVRTLTGHSRPVQRLHIAGGRLYSIGGRSLRVWDLATYACVRVLQQPRESGALSALAVSPDGTVYVAGQVASALWPIVLTLQTLLMSSLHCGYCGLHQKLGKSLVRSVHNIS